MHIRSFVRILYTYICKKINLHDDRSKMLSLKRTKNFLNLFLVFFEFGENIFEKLKSLLYYRREN